MPNKAQSGAGQDARRIPMLNAGSVLLNAFVPRFQDGSLNVLRTIICLAALLPLLAPVQGELRVPAFTAYLDPDADGARVSARGGITVWKDPALKVIWFGELARTGRIEAVVALRLPEKAVSKLRLSIDGHSSETEAIGAGTNLIAVRFGEFDIQQPGYHRFTLESLNEKGQAFGDLDALTLSGPAAEGARFNLKPRRNAASVHLMYDVPKEKEIAAFYTEVTAVEDPIHTFYMACGWQRGYFGMQVNSQTERRIIFSVWDSGNEAVDRGRVGAENRVTLLAKGPGVQANDFGNEGTGGHSHLVIPWKTGVPQRFLVTGMPTNETFTIYSGYYFDPAQDQWRLVSSWRAPKDGAWLRRLHSFSENFGGSNGHLRRRALYGNQWVRFRDGTWAEVTEASFSHDQTGREDRRDRFMGVEHGQFFLSHGGFVAGFTKFGERFHRVPSARPPVIDLTKLLSEP